MSKQARLRTQEMRRVQQIAAVRQARRRRIMTVIGSVVIVGLVVAIGVAIGKAAKHDPAARPPVGEVVAPAHLTANGTIPVGNADAPVTVTIYYDYMCPACGRFEAANGAELQRLLDEGTVRVELHPLSFLDAQSSGTKYSTRAANAIATVADAAPEHAWDFHAALYERQPHEGSSGLDDGTIAQIAAEAGVPTSVVQRFADGTYGPWVRAITDGALKAGIDRTPTIMINGTVFDGDAFSTGPLTRAIEAAAT
jgi:protein-disulfide isomerase